MKWIELTCPNCSFEFGVSQQSVEGRDVKKYLADSMCPMCGEQVNFGEKAEVFMSREQILDILCEKSCPDVDDRACIARGVGGCYHIKQRVKGALFMQDTLLATAPRGTCHNCDKEDTLTVRVCSTCWTTLWNLMHEAKTRHSVVGRGPQGPTVVIESTGGVSGPVDDDTTVSVDEER